MDNTPVLDWRERNRTAMPSRPVLEPWKPEPLDRASWPPNYKRVYAWRMRTLATLSTDPRKLASAKAYYRKRPAEFIMHWMDTYDPRREGNRWIPFVFFTKQAELIQFLVECSTEQQSGLVEKCRDAGATWIACAYSIHSWLFQKDDAIGWGSRKQDLIDQIGNPDSIFEKMRLLLNRLPSIWHPSGLSFKDHITFMKFVNPENGSTISGEAGDNIGRGGRKRIYFKDESAFYERPEKIEAALGDNTNVQIDISSVNGLGNVFHRRREAGVDWHPGRVIDKGFTRVFVIDWKDHPGKTQEWYDTRKAKYEREGMQHVFASEVDRNYSAAVMNTIIPYEWLQKCVDAHKHITWKDPRGLIRRGIPDEMLGSRHMAGLDVADEGIDRNALLVRQSIVARMCEEWGERDPGVTTRRTIAGCRQFPGIIVNYDCIGMGATVRSEFNRLTIDEKLITENDIKFVPWNAGDAVQNGYERMIADDPTSILVRDFFANLKAQAWWSIRTRCFKTFKNITEGVLYPIDELISFDSAMPLLAQLLKELAQPTRGESSQLKTLVNKKPSGTKSPNLADACVMAYFPLQTEAQILVGSYGT
ncbi:MAG TPA: hypothetical protein PK205_07145 [Promineifilum sp.]|nr:hypothetical protein [Promineifilum sp.]